MNQVMDFFVPIPAIDVRDGRCVRLQQGDFARETVYGDDPAEMARHWEAEGAQRLHIVDLDGARDGVRQNAAAIDRAIRAVSIPVQVGGGIRTLDDARALLDAGAARVVLGTAAVERQEEMADWLNALGSEQVILGLDARDGKVATHGWRETTDVDALDFCRDLAAVGVARVLYTDIARDGTLTGPNVDGVRRLAAFGGVRVLASGGVSSLDDIRALAEAGAEGAIVGKALYDRRVQFGDLLAAARAIGAYAC